MVYNIILKYGTIIEGNRRQIIIFYWGSLNITFLSINSILKSMNLGAKQFLNLSFYWMHISQFVRIFGIH